MRSDVNVDRLDIAGDFRVDINFLKWFEGAGNRQRLRNGPPLRSCDSGRHSADPAAAVSLSSASVFPWRHPAHNATSPTSMRAAIHQLAVF